MIRAERGISMEDKHENGKTKLPKKESEHLVFGLLAHVDAGKTTLAESLLYTGGALRRLGRVDHKDAFLDTYELERERGITIFAKQAELTVGDKQATLLDTPGHVDFSAEMERALQVLDYAILIISGTDGVQSHVETLWKLLSRYRIPVFLFVNKMDLAGADKEALKRELKDRLSENCLDFSNAREILAKEENECSENVRMTETQPQQTKEERKQPQTASLPGEQEFLESLALCDEAVMEQYLERGSISVRQAQALIRERKVFPCYFGSALKLLGIEAFMEGLSDFSQYKEYPEEFGARVFKISRDAQGNRLTHMKITGGSLKVKALLKGADAHGQEWQEKVNQLRRCSGSSYELEAEMGAGNICSVTGLSQTFAGEGLGIEENVTLPVLEPVLNYRLLVPEDCNVHEFLQQLSQLEEEEPLLHVLWQEETGEIHMQLMGEVQTEVLKTLIWERFQVAVEFGNGTIVYKETITEPVEGVGHFEPLRHYAEVHLLLEPGEAGSGLQFGSDCSEDVLDKNWQRLILSHLEEKIHRGVLTGSEITDMKITLTAGRVHQKHTEGGDFRQATYRALRQGLKMGKSRLLEPVYEFCLELPSEMVGRAMADLRRMHGEWKGPEPAGSSKESARLVGTIPAAAVQGYQQELISYTKGLGRLACTLKGYEPCHNEAEVVAAIGYDSERDLENPTGSVFCAHGAGFVVPYDQVYDYMHVEGTLARKRPEPEAVVSVGMSSYRTKGPVDEEELEAIFRRTYGEGNRERKGWKKKGQKGPETTVYSGHRNERSRTGQKEYLLVDGYNIIFGWEELKDLAQADIGAARGALMDILSNYQGYKKNTLILVFDAYKVEGNPGTSKKYHNIHVVYTKEAETADQYIEKVTHEIGRRSRVTVATSDGLEQVIILGQGASRMSALGLKEEIEASNVEIRRELSRFVPEGKHYLWEHLPGELAKELEEVRLGKRNGITGKKTEVGKAKEQSHDKKE